MQLHTLARRLPDEVWAVFEPILPPVVYAGEGRRPASNHACLHGLIYVLIPGIGRDYVPPCFPSGKTIQRRLKAWPAADAFREPWGQLAQRYEQLHGINWDEVLLGGSKKPAKRGNIDRP